LLNLGTVAGSQHQRQSQNCAGQGTGMVDLQCTRSANPYRGIGAMILR
jgi:hypothetical protein